MRIAATSTTILIMAASMVAQDVVSPGPFKDIEGGSNSKHLFTYAASRYQQIHTDMPSKAQVFKAMVHRQDGQYTGSTGTARTMDLELIVGHGDYTKADKTFDTNYLGTPTTAITRKKVNLPDWSKAPTQAPMPWDFVMPFDNSFAFNGKDDFVWELRNYGNTATTDYYSDYAAFSSTRRIYADRTSLGTGCTATGQSQPMTAFSFVSSQLVNSNEVYRFYFGTTNGLASKPAVHMIGATNPNISLPILCATVVTDMVVLLPDSADANGRFDTLAELPTVPYDPKFIGVKVYTQGAQLDSGQKGLGVALDGGIENELNPIVPPRTFVRNIHFSSATAKEGLFVPNTGVIPILLR